MTTAPRPVRRRPDAAADTPISVWAHVAELRRRVLYALLALGTGTLVVLPFQAGWLRILVFPARTSLTHLTYLSPAEPFMTQLKLAFAAGLLIALPIIAWQLWLFVAPALCAREQHWILRLVGVSVGLFWCGVLFAYWGAIPLAMRFFQQYRTEFINDSITIRNYVDFSLGMLIAFGLTFQLPLVLLFLMYTGIVPRARLTRNRRAVIVIILIVAAVFTPADVLSMIIMAVPLYVLFEGALLLEAAVRRVRHAPTATPAPTRTVAPPPDPAAPPTPPETATPPATSPPHTPQ